MSYVPDAAGRYTITIKYGGDEIPYSPYRIHALPTGDASKCLVTGQTPPTVALVEPISFRWPRKCLRFSAVSPQCQSEDMDQVSWPL